MFQTGRFRSIGTSAGGTATPREPPDGLGLREPPEGRGRHCGTAHRDQPSEASDAERISTLYNSACCYSKLGRQMEGLDALADAFELGFDDFQQVRRDPDLEALRDHAAFQGLLARFEKPSGLLSSFLGGFNP